MKHTKKRFAAYAILLALSAPGTQAATIVQTVWNADWNGAVWGTPAAAPTSGNDYVTAVGGNSVLRMPAGTGNSTFNGASLTISTGTIGLLKTGNGNTSTISGPLTLGGTLNYGPDAASTATLTATQLIVTGTSASIITGFSGTRLIINSTLTGSGNLFIEYGQGTDGGTRSINFANISNYTGDFLVTENMEIDFGVNYAFPGSMTFATLGSLRVNSGQTLTFDEGNLISQTGVVAPGIYTGASLDGLGANFTNGGAGATIVVIPEPSTLLLSGLGLLALSRRRRH